MALCPANTPCPAKPNQAVIATTSNEITIGDAIVEQIKSPGAYDVHYRYENWIFVNGGGLKEGGWIYFDEEYVSWLR